MSIWNIMLSWVRKKFYHLRPGSPPTKYRYLMRWLINNLHAYFIV